MTSASTDASGTTSSPQWPDEPLGRRRMEIVAICFLIALIDGFDIQATSFVAPLIARQLDLGTTRIGALLMAGLGGLMLGTICLGQLSDRLGRKRVLIGSVSAFSFTCLATATATSLSQLFFWRFVTGIGLGGATVSALAIVSDIAPARARIFLVTLMFVGFPLGGSLGGLVAIPIIGFWGWPGVFVLGGLLPIALLPLMMKRLVESPDLLPARNAPNEATPSNLAEPLPDSTSSFASLMPGASRPPANVTVTNLFRAGRTVVTLIIWALIFLTMLTSYLLISWLPSIAVAGGLPLKAAIGVAVAFNLGGVLGALLLARLVDRIGLPMLALAYLAAALFAALFPQTTTLGLTILLCALMGAGVIGAQFCVTAIAAACYPPSIRATGSGWMLGIGRIGALAGPSIGAALVNRGGQAGTSVALLAMPMLLCALLSLALARRRPL